MRSWPPGCYPPPPTCSRKPHRKDNSANVCKTNSKTMKSVAAEFLLIPLCPLWPIWQGGFFFLFTGFVWNSVIGTRTLEWDAPQRPVKIFSLWQILALFFFRTLTWFRMIPPITSPIMLQVMQMDQCLPSPLAFTVSVKTDLQPLSHDIDPNSRGFLQHW